MISYLILAIGATTAILKSMPQIENDQANFNYLDYIEMGCVIFFTIESIVRFAVCPNKLKFIMNPINIIDLLSLLTYYISLGLEKISIFKKAKQFSRILKIFSVFKVFRYFKSLEILGNTLKSGAKEIGIYLIYLLIGGIFFANLAWNFEMDDSNTAFDTILNAFW